MDDSRDSFYRFKELYDEDGEVALLDVCRKTPMAKNHVPEYLEQAVLNMALINLHLVNPVCLMSYSSRASLSLIAVFFLSGYTTI